MELKFIKTTEANLDKLPIVNGQIIAVPEIHGLFYDMNNQRHNSSELEWEQMEDYIIPKVEPSPDGTVLLKLAGTGVAVDGTKLVLSGSQVTVDGTKLIIN